MTVLDVPCADVRGDTLRWTLAPVRCTPLASQMVQLRDGLTVALNVLGASHQVVIHRDGRPLLHETIACGIAQASPLPTSHVEGGYRLASHIGRMGTEQLVAQVGRLVDKLSGRTDAVVAHFPGDPNAVTALALEKFGPSQIIWNTWHTYPQTGEIVATITSYRPEEGVRV